MVFPTLSPAPPRIMQRSHEPIVLTPLLIPYQSQYVAWQLARSLGYCEAEVEKLDS